MLLADVDAVALAVPPAVQADLALEAARAGKHETRAWIDEVRGTPGWHGGWVRWFSALQEPGSPRDLILARHRPCPQAG